MTEKKELPSDVTFIKDPGIARLKCNGVFGPECYKNGILPERSDVFVPVIRDDKGSLRFDPPPFCPYLIAETEMCAPHGLEPKYRSTQKCIFFRKRIR